MSRITTEAVRCAVCGQTSSQMTLVSAYVQGTGLDGKPLGALPRVQECPHCHYAAPRLDAPAAPVVAEMVRSPAYQRWWTAQPDAPLRRVEAAARLATAGEPLPAADLQLLAAWYAEDAGDSRKAAGHRQAYLQLVQAAGQDLDPAAMLVYLDTLRQTGETHDAETLAAQLEPAYRRGAGPGGLYSRILLRIRELSRQGDTAPHTLSEV